MAARRPVFSFRKSPERKALLAAARDSLKISLHDPGFDTAKIFDTALKILILTEGGRLLKDLFPADFDQDAKIQRVIQAYIDNQGA